MKPGWKAGLFVIALVAMVTLAGCATTVPEAEKLKTVDSLDLNRYLGSWYEWGRVGLGVFVLYAARFSQADRIMRRPGRVC